MIPPPLKADVLSDRVHCVRYTWLLFWVKYLDVFLARYSVAYVIHSGAYFIGRKPQS